MITFVVQMWQGGKWHEYGKATSEPKAYLIVTEIQKQDAFWRVMHYPNGRGKLPVELYDERYMEIGGRTWRAGEYEAWQRVKRGAS